MDKRHVFCLLAAAAFAAHGENGTWNWFTEGYTNGLSLEAAADWNDAANWVDGIVPSGDAASAYLVPSGRTSSMASFPARWIKVPEEGVRLGARPHARLHRDRPRHPRRRMA